MITEHLFKDSESLMEELHSVFIKSIEEDLKAYNKATLLLSGGSTPGPLYQRLSSAAIPWNKVDIALVDERWVDTTHSASNERLLRENLLINQATNANFLSMKNSHESAIAGAAECNKQYSELSSPYTLCLLGMGTDGHTASLFPNAKGITEALHISQYCTAINALSSTTTGDYLERMTMTPWSILQSKKLILLFIGKVKWSVYAQAQYSASAKELPLSIFLQQKKIDVDVYWAPE